MDEREYIQRVVESLQKVPETHLLLIELANRIRIEDGEIDYDEVNRIQPEVNLAIAEAKTYGSYTLMAVDSLKMLADRGQHV